MRHRGGKLSTIEEGNGNGQNKQNSGYFKEDTQIFFCGRTTKVGFYHIFILSAVFHLIKKVFSSLWFKGSLSGLTTQKKHIFCVLHYVLFSFQVYIIHLNKLNTVLNLKLPAVNNLLISKI